MAERDQSSSCGPYVICRAWPGRAWEYWTGNRINRHRQRWSTDVNRAARFHIAANAARLLWKLRDRDAMVFDARAVVTE